MAFHDFAIALLSELDLDADGPLRIETGLFDELGLDSFHAFLMLEFIESAAQLKAPTMDLPDILTLGDAFGYYLAACDVGAS